MEIVELASGLKKPIIIRKVEEEDFPVLTKKRYFFVWKTFKFTNIYKLQIEGDDDILGVMSLVDVPEDKRVEIKLLVCSIENAGKNKTYDRITGCLIAYACRLAVSKYGVEACVSLVPKTQLVEHYMKKYYMLNAGWQLYLEGTQLNRLLKEYL